MDDMLSKIRDMPQKSTPEDTIRKLIGDMESFGAHAVRSTLDRLFEILEQNPDIDVSTRCHRFKGVAADNVCREFSDTQRGPWLPLLSFSRRLADAQSKTDLDRSRLVQLRLLRDLPSALRVI